MSERTSPKLNQPYEMVIGLETHVALSTRTKAFCACPSAFGAEPNTNVCPICMGLPGAMPSLNSEALRLAAVAGLALQCRVHTHSRFDRKHYFYPDLPKGYQITQFFRPLCEGGFVDIQTGAGEKRVSITRIHLEEDAGKLLHDGGPHTLLDMNRCGVPLIEIVTGPDMRGADEAAAYLRKLRAILTYAGVSDCKMNEGSLRCDVNLSLAKPGEPLGTRTETKNLNSFSAAARAIAAEYARQAALLSRGEAVRQETCRFDPKTGLTYPMRPKETAADYRFLPEPDLPEAVLSEVELAELRRGIPALPDERRQKYMDAFGLTPYAAEQLTAERWLAEYFERAAAACQSPASLANLLLGEAFALMAQRDGTGGGERVENAPLPVSPEHMAQLADMLADGRVNSSTGKKILAALFDADEEPGAYAARHGLLTLRDEAALRAAARETLAENPQMAHSYRAGKHTVLRALMGRAMAKTGGRADAGMLEGLLRKALEE